MKTSTVSVLSWKDIKEIVEIADPFQSMESWHGLGYPDEESWYKDILRIISERNKCPMPISERYSDVVDAAERATGWKLSNCRSAENATLRSFISYVLRGEGYSFSEIGRMMERDHSTVIHHVNRMKDMLSLPHVYKPEVEMYERMCSILS